MNDWMKQNFYVFVDFETTGVPAEAHYPIQIGILITDSKFQVLDTFQSIVGWEELANEIMKEAGSSNNIPDWPYQYKNAEQYHKISSMSYMEAYRDPAKSNDRVVQNIQDRLNDVLLKYKTEDEHRVILISDNIQFEWQLLRKMYNECGVPWSFHYCGWDTSLLLCTLGVGDPKDPPHDALMDASGLHLAVVRSLEKTGWFEKEGEL